MSALLMDPAPALLSDVGCYSCRSPDERLMVQVDRLYSSMLNGAEVGSQVITGTEGFFLKNKEYFVTKIDTLRNLCSHPAFFLALLAVAFGFGLAQGGSAGIAENAHMKSNGNGWACNEGYREVGNGCVVDKVTRSAGPDGRGRTPSGEATEFLELEQENAKLRREIGTLSLRNAVLTAEAEDHR